MGVEVWLQVLEGGKRLDSRSGYFTRKLFLTTITLDIRQGIPRAGMEAVAKRKIQLYCKPNPCRPARSQITEPISFESKTNITYSYEKTAAFSAFAFFNFSSNTDLRHRSITFSL
jgi:hypothetical protein